MEETEWDPAEDRYSAEDIRKRGWWRYFRPQCKCLEPDLGIGATLFTNGTEHYRLCCWSCGHVCLSWLPHDALSEEQKWNAVTVRNNLDSRPCERCKRIVGVEFHHWAPTAIFRDANDWPTGLLCRDCHIEWHQKMTPR